MKKPVLIIIAGPNGSGKTSVTTKVLQHEWIADCIYINPDLIARDTFGDWNARDAVLKAANLAAQMREDCVAQGKSLILKLYCLRRTRWISYRKPKRRAILSGFFLSAPMARKLMPAVLPAG